MEKKSNKILSFLNSYRAICTVLTLLSVFLIIYNFYFVHHVNLYVFSGYDENFIFLDGSIYTGLDINHLTSPTITYTGEDITLKEYTVGYFIADNPISVVKNALDETDKNIKLSEFLKNAEFSFTENHRDALYFSKENIEKIDKLEFKVTGKDLNDKIIELSIPLAVEKITK